MLLRAVPIRFIQTQEFGYFFTKLEQKLGSDDFYGNKR